jgi:hypothetical protein
MARAQARANLFLKPKAECVEALRRYARFHGQTLTSFVESKVRDDERRLLRRLTPKQRALYFKGKLTLASMSDDERAAFLAPTEKARKAFEPRESVEIEAAVS